MQKVIFIIISLFPLFMLLNSCDKTIEPKNDPPTCILDKIEKIKQEDLRNPPAKVMKWEVDRLTYYYISADCCDQFSYLYDVNCTVVCAPNGGITGSGDGNCPTFTGNIKKTVVWEDTRN